MAICVLRMAERVSMLWKSDWAVDLRLWARFLIASSFLFSGLAETLSATGVVLELSPDAQFSLGFQTLALGGPLQMAGATLLASGRKTRWALGILIAYVVLGSVVVILPRMIHPDGSGSALAGMITNLAVIGGLLYWLDSERLPSASRYPPA
jgi:uncharacterized membrane protein YphA (DoxX/SURF4 family)